MLLLLLQFLLPPVVSLCGVLPPDGSVAAVDAAPQLRDHVVAGLVGEGALTVVGTVSKAFFVI